MRVAQGGCRSLAIGRPTPNLASYLPIISVAFLEFEGRLVLAEAGSGAAATGLSGSLILAYSSALMAV